MHLTIPQVLFNNLTSLSYLERNDAFNQHIFIITSLCDILCRKLSHAESSSGRQRGGGTFPRHSWSKSQPCQQIGEYEH